MSVPKKILRILASKGVLFWLIMTWLAYYVTVAIWGSEAFEHFVEGLRTNLIFKTFFIFLLVNLVIHLVTGVYNQRQRLLHKLLWLPLSLGVFIFLLGFFLSITSKHTERVVLGEEDTVKAADGEIYVVKKIQPNLKGSVLDIDEMKGFFSMEPKVTLAASDRDYEVGVYPPSRLGGSYFHIMEFGLAPGIRITSGGRTVIQGYMPQRILPPGSSDSFTVQGLPFRFNLMLSPEKVIEKGRSSARVYNLKTPAYRVTIFRGERLIGEWPSDKGIDFENLTLTFLDTGYWIRLEAVEDRGVPLVVAGIVLVIIGLPLRLALFVTETIGKRRAYI